MRSMPRAALLDRDPHQLGKAFRLGQQQPAQRQRLGQQGDGEHPPRDAQERFLERRRLIELGLEGRQPALQQALNHGAEQFRLVGEAMIESSLRNPGARGNRRDAGDAEAASEKECGRRVDDPLG